MRRLPRASSTLVAADLPDLLAALDGRKVKVKSREVELHTAGLLLRDVQPDWRTRLLSLITNPNVAYLLMLIGIYGLLLEGYNPAPCCRRGRRDLPAARAVRLPGAVGQLRGLRSSHSASC